MSEVGIFVRGIETRQDSQGYYIERTVSFEFFVDDQRFIVPIKIPMGTEDQNLVTVARAKLHDVLRLCLETTTEWGPKQE